MKIFTRIDDIINFCGYINYRDMNVKDKISMNEYYNEPEIFLVEDIENLFEEENYFSHKTKSEELLDQEIETDYHNTYYNPNTKKYGHRTIKMSNKKYHELNGEK